MLKRLLKYFSILTLIISSTACSDELAPELVAGGDGVLSITLRNSNGTRSTNSNEVAISNLVIALYPSGSDDDAEATYVEKFTNLEAWNSYTAKMTLTDEMIASLFNGTSGTKCRIFAVANIDNISSVSSKASVNDLKGISVSSPFSTEKTPSSFVMCGGDDDGVTYTKEEGASKGSAQGNVTIYRTAAKISLNISLPEKVEVKDDDGKVVETWIPVTDSNNDIVVILNNGVDKCVVSPSEDWTPTDTNDDYFDMSFGDMEVYRSLEYNASNSDYPYEIDVPLYTYPNSWEESPTETHKTVMTLRVPWQKEGEQNYVTYYYQVPVTDGESIVSNNHYIVNLSVNMLGSRSPETTKELTDLSYQVVDWGSDADIDVDMNNYRYLVVNPTTYNVYNEEEYLIPFYTSHPVEITSVTLTFQRFNFYSDGNGDVVSFTIGQDVLNRSVYTHTENNVEVTDTLCTASVVKNATTNQLNLRVKHPLEIWDAYSSLTSTTTSDLVTFTNKESSVTSESVQNSIQRFVRPTNPESPYSAYTITVELQHADNENFHETVTIKQYPGMYIEADYNAGGEYATGYDDSSYKTINNVRYYDAKYSVYGFVFVNATWHESETRPNQYVYPGYWTNDSELGTVSGLGGSSGNNKNPNMYVITVSQLSEDEGTNYIIADPRLSNYNNKLEGDNITEANSTVFSSCVTADALYNVNAGKRQLIYYLPAYEGNSDSDYAKMIGPKIRIASSYGVTTSMSKEKGRKRAATYQEQGFPAGRWRLPTLAEFKYITRLSATGKIPVLFTKSTPYWTAQGAYQVDDKGDVSSSSKNNCYIRAVYDEWYWSQFDDQYQLQKNSDGGYDFTFGDLPRKLSSN